MLGNFSCFFAVCLFFLKLLFPKNLSGLPSASNSLDPDQAQHFVWPDLGPNCLQRLQADDIGKERGKEICIHVSMT